ncbi:MAG: carboxy terminal-processing peptidase [Kiritimatiellae bacterium]|nr:carboxy terminal-processing peptidase [Kiritimatiellia bacterium]
MHILVLIAAVLLAPQNYYGRIGRQVGNMLHRLHISQRPIDAEMSQRAWTNLVSYYDVDHSVFLKSDLDELAKREKTLGAELRRSDVSFGYDVYNLFVKRLDERMDFATNLLAKGEWDFSVQESCPVKRKDAPWPETKEEAEEYWRKRIKNEVLAMRIGRELDAEDEAAKPAKTDDGDEEEEDEEAIARKNEPVEQRLIKKYRQYSKVLNEPDEESVLQYYLSAVARAYDPHTDYMSKSVKEDFDMEMNLMLGGVGAELGLDEDDGSLKIGRVMPNGPIDRDGRIKKGDKITGIKNAQGEIEDILWQPIKKSINKIRGPKGTEVTLEIQPKGEPQTRNLITLTRDIVMLEDQAATGRVERVEMNGREMKLGYVFLPSFYGTMDKRFGEEGFRSCALDVNRYVADFNAEGVDGLVLDLRGNGGGSLREAVLLSSLFVPRGPVLQVKDIHAVVAYPLPAGNVVAFRKPMIVMIDRASASASEIVAGHLQDVGRAVIVGDSRTHGKGTVQEVDELGAKKYGAMKITNARFYRVNGRSTQTEGVSPDIYLPSLLDSLDIGEDKLTYSLPFSKVAPAEYSACWDMDKLVDGLKVASDERLKADAKYQDHLKSVEGMKDIVERTEVPLEYGARKAMMRNDRDLRELDDDDDESREERIVSRRRGNQTKKDDVVLDETFRILGDLVIANDGRLLPEPKGWWE